MKPSTITVLEVHSKVNKRELLKGIRLLKKHCKLQIEKCKVQSMNEKQQF